MIASAGKFVNTIAPVLPAVFVLLGITGPLLAQTTVGTGSIVGAVSDPSGAVVGGVKMTITNVATGQVINLATNSLGSYNSGALVPGDYKVQVWAEGFNSVDVSLSVLVGNTATVNLNLQIGPETQVIEVQDSAVRVNTEQPTVQGVLQCAADRESAGQRPQFSGPGTARTRRSNPGRGDVREGRLFLHLLWRPFRPRAPGLKSTVSTSRTRSTARQR